MKKIIALVILAVVAAGFFSLTVPRHVLNTLGFAMTSCIPAIPIGMASILSSTIRPVAASTE